MLEDASRAARSPVPDWEAMAHQALADAGNQLRLPGPCTYRLIVICGPRSMVDHVEQLFTARFGYGNWEVRSAGHQGGKYELHGLRTVELCTLQQLLQHYREVAAVMGREDCGTHRILIEPVA